MRVSWPGGTVVNMSIWAFFKLDNPDMWVSNTGRFPTNEELAAILKNCIGPIQGGWMLVICIDDVLSMFTEHDQTFVRYDLEAAWDDSEPFTVEVGCPCESHHI